MHCNAPFISRKSVVTLHIPKRLLTPISGKSKLHIRTSTFVKLRATWHIHYYTRVTIKLQYQNKTSVIIIRLDYTISFLHRTVHGWLVFVFTAAAASAATTCTFTRTIEIKHEFVTIMRIVAHLQISNLHFHRRENTRARHPPWLWNPGQTSSEVQNRGIRGSTKKELCPPTFFF